MRGTRSRHVAAKVAATLPGNPLPPVTAASEANWLMRIDFLSPGQFFLPFSISFSQSPDRLVALTCVG